MGETDLIERIKLTPDVTCDIRQNRGIVKAHVYPLYLQSYWQTHLDMDLTEKEVQKILDALKRAKAKP